MMSGVLLIYLLLFSLGCGGMVSLMILYKCLKEKILKRLLLVFTILLTSLLYNILGSYFLEVYSKLPFPGWLGSALSVILVLALYISLFALLLELRDTGFVRAFYPTLIVVVVQILRSLVFYFSTEALSKAFYLPAIAFVSAYIFYIGLCLRQGIHPRWHYAVKKLIKTLGNCTMIFGPLSLVFYMVWFLLGLREKLVISLDFIFLAVWSLISLFILLEYLARMGHLPDSASTPDEVSSSLGLTPREKEVLNLLMQGFTNREIGESLFISLVTARTHVSHIFEKAGVQNRVQLVTKVSQMRQ